MAQASGLQLMKANFKKHTEHLITIYF